MSNCLGIINLDEDESKIGELVKKRPLAAVPIAARYRIIDFVLSNMTNSGVESIGIFAKSKSRALMDHLENGRPWDLHRKRDGLRLFNFGSGEPAFEDVHTFIENIEFIKKSKKKYIILAPSYMICNIDYRLVVDEHKKSKNDITVIYKNVIDLEEDFLNCDVLNINEDRKLVSVEKNQGMFKSANIGMEMYVMSTEFFIDIVLESIRSGLYKKVKGFINSNIDKLNIGCYEFKGYLSCINSLKSYYTTNMDLLNEEVSKELFNNKNPIYTKTKDEAPTLYGEGSDVNNSMIANGCCIEGEIKNCVIGRRVYINKGARIENCVVLQNSYIGEDVKMLNMITDKGVSVSNGKCYMGAKSNPGVIGKEEF